MQAPLPFDQFMARALHDPVSGYYARRIKGVGRGGDFTTAPTLSGALARAIARWATDALRETSCRHLIEIGPGEGVLAAAVMRQLPWHRRWRTKLHLVETSEPLTKLQQERLGNRAIWHKTPTDALAACNGRAVIYSNELVDAFPVRRFHNTLEGWREMGVRFNPLEEILLEPSPLPPSSSFAEPHAIGQQIEVHDSYREWLSEWMPLWKAGRMLTIDYGDTVESLYHRRPRGTLRSYLFQQRGEGLAIYENAGRQDITADVNFTDLIDWSQPWIRSSTLTTFREFVLPFVAANDPTDQQLVSEEGAGTAFQVLDQECGRG